MPIETTGADTARPGDLVGTAVQRREDPRLITGDARYTDDIQHPRTVHLAIHRSQYAHATVEDIDVSAAEAHDGVLGVYTYGDLTDSGIEGVLPADDPEFGVSVDHPVLARGTVRYQGQPIAGIVATRRDAARDALDLIEVEYGRLDAAVEPVAALDDGAPTVHAEAPDNAAFEWEAGDGNATDEAFEAAPTTVSVDLVNNRVIPTAMEPRAAVARYRDDTLIVEMSAQNPHAVRRDLSSALDMPTSRITVRVPDVGGGFGAKLQPYTGHVLASWCAKQLERPVKWRATRTEDLASMVHGRHHHTTIEAALDDGGRMQAIRAHTVADVGGYLTFAGSFVPTSAYGRMLTGQYDVSTAHVSVTGAFTNTAPLSAYRGAGRPEACYAVERLVRAAAREIGVDPVEFRRRNAIPPDEFPYETPLGHTYDSGEYERPLDAALDRIGYDDLRERQAELREEGRYLGIGFSSYVEACGVGSPNEGGSVRMNPAGEVVAMTGTQDTGQGHATSFAQIVAETLGVPYEDVEIVEGDTDRVPEGGGTAGSRSLGMGGNALRQSAERLLEKGRRIAAGKIEAAPADLDFEDGEFRVAGAPERSVTMQEVARAAYAGEVPEGVDPGLEATTFFTPDGSTYPFGTHATVVEVDLDSGEISLERYVAIDDVGTQINPKLVEGQIVGGVAQGVGQALYEVAEYDDNGTLLTGSFQDYVLPKAEHIPPVEWEYQVTPTPNNPLGAKGVGEAGAIAAPPAVVNAVVDALSPLGVTELDMPLTPETVWRAIDAAGDGD